MELISIIVPVYKVEKYLDKCVNSILKQTHKNLEIILVDDGSPDNCGKMCDEFASKDSRIKVIHKENGGLSSARNAGIEIATGKYIAFIDSDDCISEDYCETLYNVILQTNSDVAAIDISMVREDGSLIITSLEDEKELPLEINIYEKEEIVREILRMKTFKNYVCNKLYKRELVAKNKFICGINYEDIPFTYQILNQAERVAYINKKCYFYLKRSGGITSVFSEKNLNDFLDVVIKRFNDVKEKNKTIEEKYNVYGLLQSTISISIKYVISNQTYDSVDEKIERNFKILKEFMKNSESELITLLDDFQKSAIYLICYNKELFYDFLRSRHEMRKSGKII